MSPLYCLVCREEGLVERPLNATCEICDAPACIICDRCPGCDRVICSGCPTVGTATFTGDRTPHPQYRKRYRSERRA